MPDQTLPDIPLPSAWAKNVKSAVLHVISLTHYAIVAAHGWAANSINARVRLAANIANIRNKKHWSQYVVDLIANVQGSMRKNCDTSKLRFLLYPSRLLPEHVEAIKKDDAGVIWLG